MKTIRLFISSPGDVATERARSERVIHKLQVEFGGRVKLEPFYWEHEPMRATASFNDPENIPLTSEFDVVVCILWSRLGTMLSDRFRRADGSRYPSGTVFELETARESYLRHKAPDLLVYRRESEVTLPSQDKESREEKLQQLESLERFIQEWFFDKDNTFRSALNSYQSVSQFESLLEKHLRSLIKLRIEESLDDPAAAAFDDRVEFASYHAGNPFRGLEPFKFEDRDLFFGRSQAIEQVLDVLRTQRERDKSIVLVHGMSGCGKSSLVRAGVLPLITEPGVIEGMAAWRRVEFRLGETTRDPLIGLAESLFTPHALPELRRLGHSPPDLAELMKSDEQIKLSGVLVDALAQVASDLQTAESLPAVPNCALVLLVDQLEVLFSDQRQFGETAKRTFERVLITLVESGRVSILMTLRSDQLAHFEELEGLSKLVGEAGQVMLMPPSETDLSLMIRLPARAAGVVFEQDAQTGERLEDRILREARNAPDGLPLVGFVLQTLYERMPEQSNLLTHASLDQLHGLEGAVGTYAEETFEKFVESLGPEQRDQAADALSILMRAVTTVSDNPDDPPLRRVADLDHLRARSEVAGALVDQLIAARLLTSGRGEENRATVHVSHEALFRKWPRLTETIDADRDFLASRQRAETATNQWRERGRRAEFLWDRGALLADAQKLAGDGQELDDGTREFVTASVRASARRRNRRLAAAAVALIGIPVVLLNLPKGNDGPRGLTEEEQQKIQEIETSKRVKELEEQLGLVLASLDDPFSSGPREDGRAETAETGPEFHHLEVHEICRRLAEVDPDHPQLFPSVLQADIRAAALLEKDDAKAKELYADLEGRIGRWVSLGHPEHEVLNLKAQISWNRGDRAQAAILWSDYARSPELEEDQKAKVLGLVSMILTEENKWTELRQLLDEWIGWRDSAVARVRRARIALNDLRIEAAETDLAKAIELDPNLSEISEFAPQLERVVKYRTQIEEATKAINRKLLGASPELYLQRAKILLIAGRAQAALADIELAARKFRETSTLIPILRAIAQIRNGQQLLQESEVMRNYTWSQDDQGFSTYLEGNWPKFERLLSLDTGLAQDKLNTGARLERTWLLWQIGQSRLAKRDADLLVGAEPKQPQFLMVKSACAVALREYREGLQLAEAGLAEAPTVPGLHRFRAEAHFGLGQNEAALASINEAIRYGPRFWFFWEIKSKILLRLQRSDDAQAAARKATELREQ